MNLSHLKFKAFFAVSFSLISLAGFAAPEDEGEHLIRSHSAAFSQTVKTEVVSPSRFPANKKIRRTLTEIDNTEIDNASNNTHFFFSPKKTRSFCQDNGITVDPPLSPKRLFETPEKNNTTQTATDNSMELEDSFVFDENNDPETLSRHYTRTLNHTYITEDGHTVESTHLDDTHAQIKAKLSKINENHPLEIMQRNTALISLEALVEDGRENFCSIRFDVPLLFLSGSRIIRNEHGQDIQYSDGEEKYPAVCMGNFSDPDNGRNLQEVCREHVLSIMATPRESSELNYDRIKKHIKTIRTPSSDKSSKGTPKRHGTQARLAPVTGRTCIPEHYYHSEQAFLMHLRQNPEWYLENLHNNIAPHLQGTSPKLHQVTLNVISHNEVCRRCADSLLRTVENATGFVSQTNQYFKEHGYLIPQNGVHFFVAASGIEAYDREASSIVEHHLSKTGDIISNEFSPRLAHMI